MKLIFSIFVCTCVLHIGLSEKARYDNYQVYRITPRTNLEVDGLRHIMNSNIFSFWNDPSVAKTPVNIMVAPHQRPQFKEFMDQFNLDRELVIEDVQALIDEEEISQRSAPRKMEWTKYHSLSDIYSWLDELAAKYKEVKTVVAGKSYEGRDIKGIEINFGTGLVGVVIEAGIHAREWISPAGTSWMVNEILKSPANSTFRKFNYLYFPIYNPDGYDFTWKTDRLWRKTRTPYKSGIMTCYGADPNRNWGSHWNEGGSSNNPCTETYAGPRAFSEVETSVMSSYMKKRAVERKNDIYIAYHSFSQLLMYPWGYKAEPAPEDQIWYKISKAAIQDLQKVHGTRFRFGNIFSTIYQVSGSSIEWYYDALKAFIPFVYEMRDTGHHGFLLPPDQIIPSGEEHLASFLRILEEYRKIKRSS